LGVVDVFRRAERVVISAGGEEENGGGARAGAEDEGLASGCSVGRLVEAWLGRVELGVVVRRRSVLASRRGRARERESFGKRLVRQVDEPPPPPPSHLAAATSEGCM